MYKNRYLFTVILCVLLLMPRFVHGAQLFFEPVRDHEGPGFTVRLLVQYDEPINAIGGTLVFDADSLTVERIVESPAGVPLWIHPLQVSEPGTLPFAGIFPGGIGPAITDRIALMAVTFEVLRPEKTELAIRDVSVFLHGPAAQEDDVTVIPMEIVLEDGDIGAPVAMTDTVAPEPFDVRTVPLRNGPTLAVFSTRDLQTGIAYFELRERLLGIFGTYHRTWSPSKLSALWPWSILDVRATDRAGNSVVARNVPVSLIGLYAIAGLLVFWRVRRWRRR